MRNKKREAPATQTDAPKGQDNAMQTLYLDSTTETVVTQEDSMDEEKTQGQDNRRYGFFITDTKFVMDEWGAKVGPYGMAVYMVLLAHTNNNSRDSWPSRETIARLSGCSVASVKRAIKKLEQLNIITYVSRKRPDGKQTSNKYWIQDKSEWREKPGDSESPGTAGLTDPRHRGSDRTSVPRVSQTHKLDLPYLTRLTHVRAEKPNKRSPLSDNLASKPKEGPAAGVLKEFTSITGLSPLAGQTDQFTAGALAIAREFGDQAGELMREAYENSRQKGWNVTSPYSLVNTMNAIRAAKKRSTGPPRAPIDPEVYKALEAQYGGAA